ncbi:MAG: mechanosensitive ion channel domain-containing protein [Mucilaginibacter sp.]
MKEVLENWSENMPDWVWNTGVALAAVVLGLIITLIVKGILRFYRNRNDYSLFRSIITHIGRPMNHFVPLLMLNLMLPLMDMGKRYYVPLNRFLEIALIISFAVLLVRAVNVFEDYVYHVYDLNKADNLKERKIRTQMQFIRKVAISIIILITLSIVLLSFDNVRKLGAGLLTGVGVGGIIIGFAAQRSLANFLAGLQIAFTQPIRIDDVLVVEGEWGRVEDITLTYVVLNIWDQRRLILPINYFIEKPFQNWTRVSSEILGTVFLYLDYNMPMDALRQEFDRLLEDTPLWDKRVKVIQVTDATEKTIEVRVLVSASNSSEAFDLRCYLRENLIRYIQEKHPDSLPVSRSVLVNTDLSVKEIPGAGRV